MSGTRRRQQQQPCALQQQQLRLCHLSLLCLSLHALSLLLARSLPAPRVRACCARPPEVVHDTDGLGAGCVLCHEPDFLRGAFGERTIMICDTCEREFHVGCLRERRLADLKEARRAGGGGARRAGAGRGKGGRAGGRAGGAG